MHSIVDVNEHLNLIFPASPYFVIALRFHAETFADSQLCSSALFHPVRLIADGFVRIPSLRESVEDDVCDRKT